MAFTIFKLFLVRAERLTGAKLNCLCTDNGMEFCHDQFRSYLGQIGVRHQLTNTYSPQMNGMAEHLNRTLVESARTMLQDSDLSQILWGESVLSACYYNNHRLHSLTHDIPDSTFFNRKVNLRHLRVLGSLAYVSMPKRYRGKLNKNAQLGIFVGYAGAIAVSVYGCPLREG